MFARDEPAIVCPSFRNGAAWASIYGDIAKDPLPESSLLRNQRQEAVHFMLLFLQPWKSYQIIKELKKREKHILSLTPIVGSHMLNYRFRKKKTQDVKKNFEVKYKCLKSKSTPHLPLPPWSAKPSLQLVKACLRCQDFGTRWKETSRHFLGNMPACVHHTSSGT